MAMVRLDERQRFLNEISKRKNSYLSYSNNSVEIFIELNCQTFDLNCIESIQNDRKGIH